MDATLEKIYKKRLRICAVILGISAIVSTTFMVLYIKKDILANTLQKENDGLKNEIQLLKKEKEVLK